MSSAALAFLAGMGGGYMKSKDKEYDRSRQEKLDAQRDELHGANMRGLKRTEDDRTALKYAGETVTARPLEGPQPEAAYVGGQEPTQPIGYISGNGASARTFAGNGVGQEQATADAVQQNKPEARRTRMADLAAQGNAFAATALDTDHKLTQRGREDVTWTQAQTAYTKKLKDEGVFDTAAALRRGDSAAMVEAFNRSGEHQIVGDVTITPEMRDIPGRGQVPTNTATFQIKMPDGTIKQMTRNSHDLSTALMPYEKELETQLKGREFTLSERKTAVAEQQAAIAERKMDYLMYGAAAKARSGVGGGAAPGAGEPSQGPTFNPLTSFDSKKAQSVAFEQAAAKTDEKGQPLSPEAQGQLAQKIYRSMEDSFAAENTSRERARVFKSAARYARTADEVSQIRQRAMQSGYTQKEMEALDPRFALPRAPSGTTLPDSTAKKDESNQETQAPRQEFNSAGYASVQSTIDGAKRGDAKARALLQALIAQGVTTPAERNQIAKLPQ